MQIKADNMNFLTSEKLQKMTQHQQLFKSGFTPNTAHHLQWFNNRAPSFRGFFSSNKRTWLLIVTTINNSNYALHYLIQKRLRHANRNISFCLSVKYSCFFGSRLQEATPPDRPELISRVLVVAEKQETTRTCMSVLS